MHALPLDTRAHARARAYECSFDRFVRAVVLFVLETQFHAGKRSADELSFGKNPAMHYPAYRSLQLGFQRFQRYRATL